MKSPTTTARIAGGLYLLLAIAGGISFLGVRSAIVDPLSATETLANLADNETLARLGVTLEIVTVLAQAVLAVWFFALFRSVNLVAAVALSAFGLVNGVLILAAAGFSSAALVVAGDPGLSPAGDTAATVQLLYQLDYGFWGVGNLFFGLWLIPMGYLVLVSRWMPRALGWVLVAGGFGYILSLLLATLVPAAPVAVSTVLTGVASVGEFWMIGYLLVFGVRRSAVVPAAAAQARV